MGKFTKKKNRSIKFSSATGAAPGDKFEVVEEGEGAQLEQPVLLLVSLLIFAHERGLYIEADVNVV